MTTLREMFEAILPELVCKIFGHSKKLEQKMYCQICSRCRVIVKYELGVNDYEPRGYFFPSTRARPNQCIHCGFYQEEHLDNKRCLFSPTEYLSRYHCRRNQQNSEHDASRNDK